MPPSSTQDRAASRVRRTAAPAHVFVFLAFALVLLLAHSPFLWLPFFWDELGQFVPAALDLFHDGSLVPHSAIPNVHPPGVMAWLALVWHVTGYSIPATRGAMLALAAAGALFCFLLAIQLCRNLPGLPALLAVLLLFCDPLFYTQAMMAQLDMPAMVFTLAGLLLFLQDRHRLAALACTALVLTKETGVLLPLLLALYLAASRGRARTALYYLVPCLFLAAWLLLLRHARPGIYSAIPALPATTSTTPCIPVRIAVSLLRRFYFLFVSDFRWVGSIALIFGWRQRAFAHPGWRIAFWFGAAHIVLVSLLGGAELERYLLPVLPLFYIATAAAWTLMPVAGRNLSLVALTLGLLVGLFLNPPYPFPFENNLAMADFVGLQTAAAHFLEHEYPADRIHTAWPLTAALRNPDFGYVAHGLRTVETSDLHASTLSSLDPQQVTVLVLYSRTWEPAWGILQNAWVVRLLTRFYDYEPQMSSEQCRLRLNLLPVMRWTRRGQWIEIYARRRASPASTGDVPGTIAYHR